MPTPYTVSRSTTINAPAEAVYAQIVDFHNWPSWSPWEDIDPDMTRKYSGHESGEGAGYWWSGNKKAGEGSMTITNAVPNERVDIDLRFTRPFKSTNAIEFTLTPKGEQTETTWTMRGEHKGFMVLMSKFMSMDKMIGKDFEKGLAKLRQFAENPTT